MDSLARWRGLGGGLRRLPHRARRQYRIRGALQERTWGLAIYFIFLSLRLRRQALPFTMTVLVFVAAFLTLAVMFWPHIIPYEMTVANAATPESSLSFRFWGAGLFALPVIAIDRDDVLAVPWQVTHRICGHTLNRCGK